MFSGDLCYRALFLGFFLCSRKFFVVVSIQNFAFLYVDNLHCTCLTALFIDTAKLYELGQSSS